MKDYSYVIVKDNKIFGIDESLCPIFLKPDLYLIGDMEMYGSKKEAEDALKLYIEKDTHILDDVHILDDAKVMKMVTNINLEEI